MRPEVGMLGRNLVPMGAVLAAAALASADDGTKPPKGDVSVVVAFPEQGKPGASHMAGSSLFKTYCATCHGPAARGDGPLADQLRVRPPDLTLFARRNGGTFDKEKVRRIVDGRDPVKGHGGADMPVWGDVFKNAEEGYSEKKALTRIQEVVDYLAEMQRE